MAIVTIDGYGRPRQLEKEFRETLERVLELQFGKQAKMTALTKTAYKPESG